MKARNIILITLMIGIMGCNMAERNYLDLHKEAIVVDTHSDTPLRMAKGFDFSQKDTAGHVDIPRLREGGVDLQVFACFVGSDTPPEECRSTVDELIDSLEAQVSRHPDKIALCTTATQAEDVIRSGRIAGFIGIENGVAINNSLENLQHFYDRGVRYMTLTHMSSSEWCASSSDSAPAFHGLADFGREVVARMNELGMLVDISHASVSAVEEVLRVTSDPVIASHSCVHSICPHDRNLTDAQIEAIAENGGVIGINFFSGYLSPGNRWIEIADSIYEQHREEIDSVRAVYPDDFHKRNEALRPIHAARDAEIAKLGINISTVVDHIDHIVKLVGPDHVGLGSDFDGVSSLPQGLSDCSDVPNITRELVRRGYSEEDVLKILGGNFMRVFRQVCDR